MTRKEFMQEARLTAHKILEGKENGIMNLVQQAWAEGKRNAEVETLRAAIDEALDRREDMKTMSSEVESCPEPVYPTWGDWFVSKRMLPEKWDNLTSAYMDVGCVPNLIHSPIPADIADKLGIEPKGES